MIKVIFYEKLKIAKYNLFEKYRKKLHINGGI